MTFIEDIHADGRDEFLVPAELVHDWYYLLAGQAEPTAVRTFDARGSSPRHNTSPSLFKPQTCARPAAMATIPLMPMSMATSP